MSCSDDDDSVDLARYKFIYLADDGLNRGIKVDIIVIELNDIGERINTVTIDNCTTGFSNEYNAKPQTKKIKVYMTITKEYAKPGKTHNS